MSGEVKPCYWVEGKSTRCSREAVAEIRVRNRVSSVKVPICSYHKAMHDENAAALRVRQPASNDSPQSTWPLRSA